MSNPDDNALPNAEGLGRKISTDADPQETKEWIDAFQGIAKIEGKERATYILRQLLQNAREMKIPLPAFLNTPYKNTIPIEEEPHFPGDKELESKISALVRWNALAMVVRANRKHSELGGHIATYASSAELFEVGFNHFFKAGKNGDCVYFQPHSAPGVYARAFLEGRLKEEQLNNYRQESSGSGLSSYCHPWLMPDFWQFPTGSMGLGPINAIYQARFMRYLEHRNITKTSDRKVWCFVGDGEMDEPESIAGLSIASRERLDNLIFVVNCNLQRLDGPVRGNGSIVQELESLFTGGGWNVIKVLWGSDWDSLFARDSENILLRRLHEMVDGELQTYAAMDGKFNREHVFHKYPELRQLVENLSDDEIDRLRRGGHDPIKIHAAYNAAVNHKEQPTVILAQTKKGFGMGHWGQGKMGAHQQKKLETDALLAFRDRFSLPINNEDVENLVFVKPPEDSPEIRYLHDCRKSLGGYLPNRMVNAKPLQAPLLKSFSRVLEGSNDREQSTTMVFVNLLSTLLRDKNLGKQVVPIVADEARTFGMQSLFRQIAIYSPFGQLYDPEDKDELLFYKEAQNGQILEEGITEAGAISSWLAAATAYSAHDIPMLPFYIFYSCFGFQRIGDLIWAAGDSRARGFLIGATAGRTTLSGEGLQHEDGSSHLLMSTIPNCVAYDPAYGYELAVIIQNGIQRMLTEKEDVFYYLTVMNENYQQPSIPKKEEEGILKGMYRIKKADIKISSGKRSKNPIVQLLGSGTILRESLKAAEKLKEDWGVLADVWSVTSFTELYKNGISIDRLNRFRPNSKLEKTWVEKCLTNREGPVIAATDYMRAVPDLIRAWIPQKYVTLGTDGYGRSDTRTKLREFYEVDSKNIVVASLKALADLNEIDQKIVTQAIKKYKLSATKKDPWLM